MRGQLHASAALSLVRSPRLPIGDYAGWDPYSVWVLYTVDKFPPILQMEEWNPE